MSKKHNHTDDSLDQLYRDAYNDSPPSPVTDGDWSAMQEKWKNQAKPGGFSFSRTLKIFSATIGSVALVLLAIRFSTPEHTPTMLAKPSASSFQLEKQTSPRSANSQELPAKEDSPEVLHEIELSKPHTGNIITTESNPQLDQLSSPDDDLFSEPASQEVSKGTNNQAQSVNTVIGSQTTKPIDIKKKQETKKEPIIYIAPADTVIQYDTSRVSKRKAKKKNRINK